MTHPLSTPNTTQTPNYIFDHLLSKLTGSELKVLLYIVRRINGFHKIADDICLDQICHGITKSNGEILDRGTGLSKASVAASLIELEKRGLIKRERRVNRRATYRLSYEDDELGQVSEDASAVQPTRLRKDVAVQSSGPRKKVAVQPTGQPLSSPVDSTLSSRVDTQKKERNKVTKESLIDNVPTPSPVVTTRKSTAEKRESRVAKTQREIAALRQRLDGGSAATLDAVVAALPKLEARPGDQEVIAGLIVEHPQVDWAQLARNIKARYASNAGTVRWAEKFNTFIANSLNPKMKYNIPHVDGTSRPLVRGEVVAQPVAPLAHKFDRSDRHTAPKLYDDALWQIVLDQMWQDDSHRWTDADKAGVESSFEYGYSKLVPMGVEEVDGEGLAVLYTIGFPSSISRWLRDLKWKIEKAVLVSYRYHNDISHETKLDLKVEWIDLG